MVSKLTIFFLFISLALCIGYPISLIVYMIKRKKLSWKALFVGALVFIIFQILLRMPMLDRLQNSSFFILYIASDTLYLAIFLGLTAGLFEETGRFVGFKFLLKDKLSYEDGISFGIGHGGIEAIILVMPSIINAIVYSFMINAGKLEENLLAKGVSEGTIKMIRGSLTNIPSYTALFGGLERVFAITSHIAMTLMVLYSIKYKKVSYFIYAVLFHMVLDSPLVIFSKMGFSTALIEGYIFLISLVAIYIIFKFKKVFENND